MPESTCVCESLAPPVEHVLIGEAPTTKPSGLVSWTQQLPPIHRRPCFALLLVDRLFDTGLLRTSCPCCPDWLFFIFAFNVGEEMENLNIRKLLTAEEEEVDVVESRAREQPLTKTMLDVRISRSRVRCVGALPSLCIDPLLRCTLLPQHPAGCLATLSVHGNGANKRLHSSLACTPQLGLKCGNQESRVTERINREEEEEDVGEAEEVNPSEPCDLSDHVSNLLLLFGKTHQLNVTTSATEARFRFSPSHVAAL
ncbi:hypothetical protein F2P81_016633 [Scophthalmus maximus]|uniref:Uncharacterized protein n=1 Tax=Scophthalmus maximus TaxID=52904 RepID=A0A6A4SIP8_SCOMX|nr:hypothetical protein F2P81_016633 [Scophthalmus maximus]